MTAVTSLAPSAIGGSALHPLLERFAFRLAPGWRRSPESGCELVVGAPGHTDSVLAMPLARDSDPAIVLLAVICDERSAAAERVLRYAGHMGAGALALVGAHYVVRYVIPAAQLDVAPLEHIIRYVASCARAMQVELGAERTAATDVTAYFGVD